MRASFVVPQGTAAREMNIMANRKPVLARKVIPARAPLLDSTPKNDDTVVEDTDEVVGDATDTSTTETDTDENSTDEADDATDDTGDSTDSDESTPESEDISAVEPAKPVSFLVNAAVNLDVQDWAGLPNAPKHGIVLGPGEPLRVDGTASADGTHITLTKPVFRAYLPMGSKRWAFGLEYQVGATLAMSIVQPVNRDQ